MNGDVTLLVATDRYDFEDENFQARTQQCCGETDCVKMEIKHAVTEIIFFDTT